MAEEGVRVIAEGGFDHLREELERRLLEKRHDKDAVLAVVNRLEEGFSPSAKWSLPSALSSFIRRCEELGVSVDIDIAVRPTD